MGSEKDFLKLKERVEQLEREVQNLKINHPNFIGRGPHTWPFCNNNFK